MKKLIFLAALIVAGYFFKPQILGLFGDKAAFDDQGNPVAVLLTLSNCKKPCDDAFEFLAKRRINFKHYEVDENEQGQQIWKDYGHKNMFPTLIVGSDKVYGFDRSRFTSVLALNFGDAALMPVERRLMARHFYPDGYPKIVIYGTSWCPYCKKLREELLVSNIDFTEIDVERASNRSALEQVFQITGYPTTYVGYERLGAAKSPQVIKAFKAY